MRTILQDLKAALWHLLAPAQEDDPDPQSTADATAARTEWIRRNRVTGGGG